jgi:hypothetical protein
MYDISNKAIVSSFGVANEFNICANRIQILLLNTSIL